MSNNGWNRPNLLKHAEQSIVGDSVSLFTFVFPLGASTSLFCSAVSDGTLDCFEETLLVFEGRMFARSSTFALMS